MEKPTQHQRDMLSDAMMELRRFWQTGHTTDAVARAQAEIVIDRFVNFFDSVAGGDTDDGKGDPETAPTGGPGQDGEPNDGSP